MFSAANEDWRASTVIPRVAVDRVREMLDAGLTATGEDIRAVATQFEKLAAEVQRILELTSDIVACIRQDWVQSIVPITRTLDAAARSFIAERIESTAAIAAVFTRESGMIENLLSLTQEQRSIAREGKTLGVMASIEVARLGVDRHRFGYMARELDEFAAMVSAGSEKVVFEAEQRRASLIDRRRKLDLSLQKKRSHFRDIESELGHAIAALETALAQLESIPAEFQACVGVIASDVSSVVEAVQLQDLTRQQTEHVRDALIGVSERIAGDDAQTNDLSARCVAILKIQALQIESAQASSEGWISKINRCLESIVRVGSSDVVAIGVRILVQERALSGQLTRIEHLEHECRVDDAEVEASFAGLDDLMRITKAHIEQSRMARDRMRLLNFNSMIEARHLGIQASAILEITRNIGRISAAWSELTDRSGVTLETMFSSSAQAEETHRARTGASMEELCNARLESEAALRGLSEAASTANANGEKIAVSVADLHSQIATLSRMAEQLKQSTGTLAEARHEIDQAARAPLSAGDLSEDDRKLIERECSATYTSELERRILHAALYDEPLTDEKVTVIAHDVELF